MLAAPGPAGALRIPVEHVDGRILDVHPDRVLYRADSGLVAILDRTTRNVTPLPLGPGTYVGIGYLSPHGAIYEWTNGGGAQVSEFRDGVVTDLGPLNSQASLRVAGRWAIWSNGPALYRRDLESATTVTVSTNAGNTDNDVNENGDVVYWAYPDYQIFRFDGASSTQLTHDTDMWNTYVLTDGINAAYRKTPAGNPFVGSVAISTPGGEVVLDSYRDRELVPGRDFAVGGGWVAFTRLGAAGERQVWLRDPSGAETRASPTGLDTSIDALGATGEVIFHDEGSEGPNPGPYAWRGYYLSRRGAPRRYLGTAGGRFFWEDGAWYQTYAGTVYRIDPDPDPYPRPRGATPFRASLVNAYSPCTSSNSSHGPPLAYPSCRPARPASDHLTVGTPDSNGLPERSEGSLLVRAQTGNLDSWADEADAKIDFSYIGVFNNDLSDYTGELRPVITVQRTDHYNPLLRSGGVDNVDGTHHPMVVTTTTDHGLQDGDSVEVTGNNAVTCLGAQYRITVTGPRTFLIDILHHCGFQQIGGSWRQTGTLDPVPATGTEVPISLAVPCVATPPSNLGSDCGASTSADAVLPGLVREGDRSIWEFDNVRVYDGGADGIASTLADNTLFATQGVFIP
jgi:hypothetical protein